MEKKQKTDKPLEKQIEEDIKITGYPTEMQSASIMLEDKWTVFHNPSFLDKDEGICREFDIEATKIKKHRANPSPIPTSFTPEQQLGMENRLKFFSTVRLLCECKKSNKPWVFFLSKESDDIFFPSDYIHKSLTLGSPEINEKFLKIGDYENQITNHNKIRSAYHYFEKDIYARTYYEPFKNEKDKDTEKSQQIYKAVMSCIKATLYYQAYRKPNYFFINYPVIIFNGELFTSNVLKDKIEVKKASHVQLVVNYVLPFSSDEQRHSKFSPLGDRQKFIIDVVKYDYLESFLSIINKEFLFITTFIEEILRG